MPNDNTPFTFKFSLSTLEHLGRGLYRSFATVIAEAVSNAWDAEATRVDIKIEEDKLTIQDNGIGMDNKDFQDKFLKIGYSKRRVSSFSPGKKRHVLGRKGIGKLAYLSISKEINILTKKNGSSYVSARINNADMDKEIDNDKESQEYNLKNITNKDISRLKNSLSDTGTLLEFNGLRPHLRKKHIPEVLAIHFHFSQVLGENDEFKIYVNGDEVSAKNLENLYNKIEYIWYLGKESKKIFKNETRDIRMRCKKEHILSNEFSYEEEKIKIRGYIASVEYPSHLVIPGAEKEDRAGVALFAYGRMRTADLMSQIPTAQIPQSYLMGRIYIDKMDEDEVDRFTTARDSIKESDPIYQTFLGFLTRQVKIIINQWKNLRNDAGKSGDPEGETQKKLIDRLITASIKAVTKSPEKKFMKEIRAHGVNNIQSYLSCYVAENAMRYYMKEKNIPPDNNKIKEFRQREKEAKRKANFTGDIRLEFPDGSTSHLSYLDSETMAGLIDIHERISGEADSFEKDIKGQKPIRNALMHTSCLNNDAKIAGKRYWGNIVRKVLKYIQKK